MAGIKNLDQRQINFLIFYLDPKSTTYANALQSALRAGFKDSYARTIASRTTEWVSDAVRKRELMLAKAERNLDDTLDLNTEVEIIGLQGPILTPQGQPMTRTSTELLKIKHDATKFVAERLGKKHYAARNEIGVLDPKELELADEDRKQIEQIFAENMKALPAPKKK